MRTRVSGMVGGLALACSASLACGGSTASDGAAPTGGHSGTGAASSGGTGAAGGVGTGGSAAGGGVSSGGVSSGGVSSGGSGGVSGGAGGAPGCESLDYCDCAASNCQVYAEPCFCPCDEACQPEPCACACGGGAYLGCGPVWGGAMGEFVEQVVGTWLIGWMGGLNHFSWLRLEPNGVARLLDGQDLNANIPFWECNGVGSWMVTAKMDTVGVYFPTHCNDGFVSMTFSSMQPHTGYPDGATLAASVDLLTTQTVNGYKFPHAFCDAALTTCKDPL